MARLAWDTAGSRYFEAGVERGVLYVGNAAGVPWTGLISVEETPSRGEIKAHYIDGIKYLNLATRDEFGATIRAYTYPNEFSQCDGTARIRAGLFFGQQSRVSFGFCYRTTVGNDTEGAGHGYKLHLVYNALAMPSSRSASSYSDSVEATEFSWDVSTKSRKVLGSAPTAHVVVDSRYTHPLTMASIEDVLYGSDSDIPRLLTPEELITIFDIPVVWELINNEDGTISISGPDPEVNLVGSGLVELNHSSVSVGEDTITITY